MTGGWTHKDWACKGEMHEDGSMTNGEVFNAEKNSVAQNQVYNSIEDFEKYVDNQIAENKKP